MPDTADMRVLRVPYSRLVRAACREILSAHSTRVPDLTSVVVLVPNLHASSDVARELREQSGFPVLLLPKITTLRAWAEEVAVERPVQATVAREVLLYQALVARRWFEQADLWAIAAELSGLFDELTRWHVGMPDSVADFRRRLEAAYRARAGASFELEAKLVCELWHIFAQDDEQLDAEAAYQLRLGRLAVAGVDALYALGIGIDDLAPAERAFMRQCGERLPVRCFEPGAESELNASPVERVVAHAWSSCAAAPVMQRADDLRMAFDDSPLRGRLSFCGVRGIEQEAHAVDIATRRWLHEGCERIAVVVFDRLTARRARALLERAQVLVRDEVGWALATTSASTVISRWFDACGNDFYHRDLLDFLKSPFVMHDWERQRRQETVWRLERAVRRQNVRAGLERYLALAADDDELRAMLAAVQSAANMFDVRKRRALAEWLRSLETAMTQLGVVAGLAADAAGQQLLALLNSLASELAGHSVAVRFSEFRRWLSRCLETGTFRDTGIESPVVFTSLSGIRLRRFDAVLLAGADALNLSTMPVGSLFFNQSVRSDLGLPGHAQTVRLQERDLTWVLAATPRVCVTWQQIRDGESNLLAPVLERLSALHRLAWKDSLDDPVLSAAARTVSASVDMSVQPVRPAARPSAKVSPQAVPATISASSYNALMACPYQFYAHHVLRLKELDDVQEDLEKAGYGNLVHEALHRFHQAWPSVSELPEEDARSRLLEVSRDVFAQAMTFDYLARAWLLRWEKLVPGYVAWQREREGRGWMFRAAEVDRRVAIETPAGRRFELLGRIDRIDERSDGAVSVVDYKTQSQKRLQEKLEPPGEDVQLPVYGLLWNAPVGEAMFLSLDREEVCSVPLAGDLDVLTRDVRERLARLLDRMCEGAPLAAHGSESACAYCRVQGLCRRKHWP